MPELSLHSLICSAFPEAKSCTYAEMLSLLVGRTTNSILPLKPRNSYDSKDVAAYYKLYNGLMRLWQSEYDKRIYNLNYEELTSNQTVD